MLNVAGVYQTSLSELGGEELGQHLEVCLLIDGAFKEIWAKNVRPAHSRPYHCMWRVVFDFFIEVGVLGGPEYNIS